MPGPAPGFSCSSARSSIISTTTTASWNANRWSAWPRRAADGLPPRRLLLRHGHLSRIPVSERPLEQRRGALEGLGMTQRILARPARPGHRRNRPCGQLAGQPSGEARRRRRLPGARLGSAERIGPQRDARARQSGPRRCVRSRRSSNARSANTKSTRSFIWPRRPSSASPTAIRFPPSKAISRGTWNVLEAAGARPR